MLPDRAAFEDYKKFWAERADEVGFLDYKEMKVRKKGYVSLGMSPDLA